MMLQQIFAIIGVFLMLNRVAYAQDKCRAEDFFRRDKNSACILENMGKKCIILDITQSIDKKGKEFVYRWHLGDGSVKEGSVIEHCYQNYGIYLLVLDVIDEKNNISIENEFSEVITLAPEVGYITDTVYQGFSVKFKYDEMQISNSLTKDVFWKIEGQFYCGAELSYAFKNKGLNLVEARIVGDMKGKQIRGCKLVNVFVE